ncbi:MAG: Superoxide reductase [Synergistales bacterium 54_9]|jgi:superoxide reductase|nr:MAG: Superoxide reductase [Synergistales bacterium 54_9]MDK2846255.1 superoxide reductase [Synergistales bacterium]MDN5336373.1 superoxide reductase [Synergistales bacterium]HAG22148.1 desulfoferrodoxin [Synergistaceae bacterium]
MAKLNEVYKCELCGNMVIVVHDGAGELVCCGQPMKRMEEQTADSATEKHVPVIEKKEEGILVKVGSVPHPMEEKHYIEWIELTVDGTVLRRFLKPQEAPEALFKVKGEKLSAREYCNVHGLWRS